MDELVLAGYVLAIVNDPERYLEEVKVPPNVLVLARSSIAEATQIVSLVIPMAVLTEHKLADGEGIDLVLVLKKHPSLRHVPVILLGMDDLQLYQRLGITGFVHGDWQMSEVNELVSELLADQLQLLDSQVTVESPTVTENRREPLASEGSLGPILALGLATSGTALG